MKSIAARPAESAGPEVKEEGQIIAGEDLLIETGDWELADQYA